MVIDRYSRAPNWGDGRSCEFMCMQPVLRIVSLRLLPNLKKCPFFGSNDR